VPGCAGRAWHRGSSLSTSDGPLPHTPPGLFPPERNRFRQYGRHVREQAGTPPGGRSIKIQTIGPVTSLYLALRRKGWECSGTMTRWPASACRRARSRLSEQSPSLFTLQSIAGGAPAEAPPRIPTRALPPDSRAGPLKGWREWVRRRQASRLLNGPRPGWVSEASAPLQDWRQRLLGPLPTLRRPPRARAFAPRVRGSGCRRVPPLASSQETGHRPLGPGRQVERLPPRKREARLILSSDIGAAGLALPRELVRSRRSESRRSKPRPCALFFLFLFFRRVRTNCAAIATPVKKELQPPPPSFRHTPSAPLCSLVPRSCRTSCSKSYFRPPRRPPPIA